MEQQMKELQHAIQENVRKLEEVREKRRHVEEQIIQSTIETKRRMDLIMEKSEVVDALQELGHLLQEETDLCDQMNDQASADRAKMSNLQEKCERTTNKVKHLLAEIQEVKQCLEEVKAQNTAQALIPVPSTKTNRK